MFTDDRPLPERAARELARYEDGTLAAFDPSGARWGVCMSRESYLVLVEVLKAYVELKSE